MPHTLQPQVIALLNQLADGKFHSGERLAQQFGISRSSIFNALEQAQRLGVRIQAVRGRGYRLPDPVEWLSADDIKRWLGGHASRFQFHLHPALPSTNTWLMERSGVAEPGWVCCAEYQYQGKGRRGRGWQAALGGSLVFSVLQRFEAGLASLSGLSLAVGLAMARALNRHVRIPVGLKWPNDLVVGPRKLGGILVEVQGDMDGPALAVIGVGLNVRLPSVAREQIDQAIVDLAELEVSAGRNRLLAECLIELEETLAKFKQQGFSGLREAWQELDAYRDRPVALVRPDGTRIHGTACGVDAAGALLLTDAAGRRAAYSGGELSLRPVAR